MTVKEIFKCLGTISLYFFTIVFIIAFIVAAIRTCNKPVEKLPSPVERNEIDSLSNSNKVILIEVNNLDSIKDAKVVEVKSLDNDSTLKLFYELIRE